MKQEMQEGYVKMKKGYKEEIEKLKNKIKYKEKEES